jgi:alpha-N-arabinofuranosidase
MAPLVDFHSIHIYTGSDDYWTNVLQPHQAERAISYTRTALERAAYRQEIAEPPGIAIDEWNVWFRAVTGGLEERHNFADALAVGTYLNIFTRNCDCVRMANLAQMVNAIAPVVTTPETAVVQPIYYPVLLHAQAALDVAADVRVNGGTVCPELPPDPGGRPHRIADLAPFALVDAAATVSADSRRVAATLVNRSREAERAEVLLRDHSFDGRVRIRTLTAGGDGEPRALPDVATARLDQGEQVPANGALVLTLPPESFTVIEAAIARA